MNVNSSKVMKLASAQKAASRVFINTRYRLAQTTLTNTKMNFSCTVKALITSWRKQKSSESSARKSKSNSRNGKEKTTLTNLNNAANKKCKEPSLIWQNAGINNYQRAVTSGISKNTAMNCIKNKLLRLVKVAEATSNSLGDSDLA